MMPEKKPQTRAVFTAYAKAAWKHPWLVSAAILSALGVEAAGLIWPLYLRQFIDVLSSSPGRAVPTALLVALAAFLITRLIGRSFQYALDMAAIRTEAQVMQNLYNEAFEKLMRHSHEFFISNFTGALTRRVARYAASFQQIFEMVVYTFLSTAVFILGAVGILATRNLALGAGLLIGTIVFITVQAIYTRRLQPLRLAANTADSELTGVLSDAVINHAAVTTFAGYEVEHRSFIEKVVVWRDTSLHSWIAQDRLSAIQGFIVVIIQAGLLSIAIIFWQRGMLTIGDFVLLQTYIVTLIQNIWNMGQNMRQFYEAIAGASEMLDIIERPLDIADKPGAQPLVVREGEVRFDHVRFAYKEGRDVLADFDLTIAPREKVAFVGPSGAGKSTITKLLLRLYDVSGGAVTIDGQDIREVTQESVRRAIAFVPQDPALFHRTLRENIRYGRPDATDEEVVEAARQAHCLEFIERYPEGFDALVDERGVKLSGGERQRVAIARAILKDAPILVLDEATSSLDSESEALIQDALKKLMEGKTVIAIAHRLSTVMHMDRIVVMESGSVVLSGTHDELLAQESNLYKKLWEIQAGGFIA